LAARLREQHVGQLEGRGLDRHEAELLEVMANGVQHVLKRDLLRGQQPHHSVRCTGLAGHRRRLYTALVFDCRHQPLHLPRDLVAQLAAAYGEPHRAYHNASHIAEVLGWFDRVADDVGWHRPAEVYVAIVFHDAIYEPAAKDNEARSASWARSAGLPVDGARVAELI